MAAAVFASRSAEVEQLHVAAVPDHDVLRAEIAVHDAERLSVRVRSLVDVCERLGERDADGDGFCPVDRRVELRPSASDLGEVSSLDVLDDDERLSARIGRCLEHPYDSGVIELRLDARFVEEAREERWIRGMLAADDLH